jgi:VanZ family protein
MRITDRRHLWKTRISNWLPVCAWASLIFFFSTDHFSSANTAQLFGFLSSWLFPELPTEDIGPVHGLVRKLGHWTEYFVLAVLLLRALHKETGKKWELRHAVLTLLFIFVYALSDELHQVFVPSRTASFGDVMIDVLGGICGIFWMVWYGRGTLAPTPLANKGELEAESGSQDH